MKPGRLLTITKPQRAFGRTSRAWDTGEEIRAVSSAAHLLSTAPTISGRTATMAEADAGTSCIALVGMATMAERGIPASHRRECARR
jgi:hypothetical protein